MIYRVHLPHNNDGSFGKAIGYVSVCPKQPSMSAIYSELCRFRFLAFPEESITFSIHVSELAGVPAYSVRKRRQAREQLLYLEPLKSKQAIDQSQSSLVNGGVISWSSLPSRITTTPRFYGGVPLNNLRIQPQIAVDGVRAVEQQVVQDPFVIQPIDALHPVEEQQEQQEQPAQPQLVVEPVLQPNRWRVQYRDVQEAVERVINDEPGAIAPPIRLGRWDL